MRACAALTWLRPRAVVGAASAPCPDHLARRSDRLRDATHLVGAAHRGCRGAPDRRVALDPEDAGSRVPGGGWGLSPGPAAEAWRTGIESTERDRDGPRGVVAI